MNLELINRLKQNRRQLKKIDGAYEHNDYSINQDIENVFLAELGAVDLKTIKDKEQLFSLISELAQNTINQTVNKISNYSAITDFDFRHELRVSELYLSDLIQKMNKSFSNILLLQYYKTQIDYLILDLKTHPWGEEYVKQLCSKVNYDLISKSAEKVIDSASWSLYWNEEFQQNKDRIKYAILQDPNQINYVPMKDDKKFMIELLDANPECFFGMSEDIKADKEVIIFIIKKDWRQFVEFANDSLKNEQFLRESGLNEDNIKFLLEQISKNKPKDSTVVQNSKSSFDSKAYQCENFIEGLNKCNSRNQVIEYIDNIINKFPIEQNKPKIIGTPGNLMSKNTWSNGGRYNGFIDPSIKISNATLGYSYQIYDNDYLYDFAIGIRKMNLKSNSNILPYVMKFLDYYFGFPKDNKDRRDDVLYNFAVKHAEEFYIKHNIPINPEMGAVDQMQMNGNFPLSALKNAFAAQCIERSALAQNIMKVCGYDSFIMYGDCESKGNTEGHCWNSITDSNGNIMIIDYSNTVYSYRDGIFLEHIPYSAYVSEKEYLANDGIIEMPDYHYENGKKISDNQNRKYAVGKSLSIIDEKNSGNKLK